MKKFILIALIFVGFHLSADELDNLKWRYSNKEVKKVRVYSNYSSLSSIRDLNDIINFIKSLSGREVTSKTIEAVPATPEEKVSRKVNPESIINEHDEYRIPTAINISYKELINSRPEYLYVLIFLESVSNGKLVTDNTYVIAVRMPVHYYFNGEKWSAKPMYDPESEYFRYIRDPSGGPNEKIRVSDDYPKLYEVYDVRGTTLLTDFLEKHPDW